MWSTIVAILVAVAVTAIARPGFAQEPQDLTSLSPEELGQLRAEIPPPASKYLQRITDAPASVSVVTAEEIHLYGYRTLADVLNSVRGMSVSYDRNYTYLGLRGLSRPGDLNTRVLVLIDGHRLNDNVFDSALIGDEFPLDLESIARVEISRGPGAAMYGTGAFSAVVSVITKRANSVQGVEAEATLGTLDTRGLRAVWGHTAGNGVRLLVVGSTQASSGEKRLYFPEFDAPATNAGIADHVDGAWSDRLAMNLDAGHFSLQSVWAVRQKHIPTASFGTLFNDPRTRTLDERGYLDLQYGRELGQRFDVIARAYYDHYDYDGWYIYGNDDGAPTINRDQARGHWMGGEFNVSHRLTTRQRITAGAEYRQSLAQDQQNFNEPPSGVVYLDDHRELATWALNLQDELSVSSRLQLSAAVRYESVPTGAARLSPKIGVITHLSAATTVKLLFSRALRDPSVYERFYESPPFYVSNPSLEPERIQSVEVAFEHAISPWAQVSGSVFDNRLVGVIVSTAGEDGLIRFVNGLNARARGFEVEWNSRSRAGVHTRASYSALFESEDQIGWFGGEPTRLVKFNVGLPIARLGVTTGISVHAEGARLTHTGEVLPPAAVTSWSVVRPLGKNVEIRGTIFNLLGVGYSEPASTDHVQGGIPQDGRQVVVKLLWRIH